MNTDHTLPRYVRPDRFTQHVFNPFIARLTKFGVSMWGSRVLSVPGRTSGVVRTTPVNLLTIGEDRCLVAPRGVTEWVKNVRVAGGCTLSVGRRREEVRLIEVNDADKPEILRSYLRRWKWEVGQFFDGVGPDADDARLLAIAPGYPVFRVTTKP